MKKSIITVDMGYGDSGKGTITDWLVREHKSQLVVRYNGGPQAFHTVYDGPTGLRHIFRQYGSGLFSRARTIIGPEMVVNPLSMMRESEALNQLGLSTHGMMLVSENALIVTPYHAAANRIRETFRISKHGSTGMGVGETRRLALLKPEMSIKAGDCSILPAIRSRLLEKLEYVKQTLYEDIQVLWRNTTPDMRQLMEQEMQILEDRHPYYNKDINLADQYHEWFMHKVGVIPDDDLCDIIRNHNRPVVFEASQGVLLDKKYGFHPHTTWSDITPKPAFDLLPKDWHNPDVTDVIGISRTYATRHGAGPFVTEGLVSRDLISDDNNPPGALQGGMRVGALDLQTLKYAMAVCRHVGTPITKLAFTHCDKFDNHNTWPVCHGYGKLTQLLDTHKFWPEEASVEAEGLTTQLMTASPEIVQHKTYRVLDDISAELQIPIAVKSFGKKNTDKIKLC